MSHRVSVDWIYGRDYNILLQTSNEWKSLENGKYFDFYCKLQLIHFKKKIIRFSSMNILLECGQRTHFNAPRTDLKSS